jgi:hypothetical protein
MLTKSIFSNTLFITFAAISFYSFGTAMMDYFLLYPSRFLVGENEFIRYHQLLESAILPISVVPFLFITLMNFLLMWFRPAPVSKTFLFISLICLVLDVISTAIVQAPWNYELSKGKDVILMQKITDTNWARIVLESLQVIVVFYNVEYLLFQTFCIIRRRCRAAGITGELNAASYIGSSEEKLFVIFNGIYAQVEPVCNFLIGKPQHNQFNDIILSRRNKLIQLSRVIRVYLNDISLYILLNIKLYIEELFIGG